MPETAAHDKKAEIAALTQRHQQDPLPLDTEEFTPTSVNAIDPGESLTPLPEEERARLAAEQAAEPTRERSPKPEPAPRRPRKEESDADLPPPSGTDSIMEGGGKEPSPSASRPLKAAPGGSQVAFDLFDAIEKEIEHEREELKTQVQEDDKTEPISCPVCSHRFNALVGLDSVVCPKCGSDVTNTARYEKERQVPESKDPMVGATIRGCQVDRKIGEGGMGSVYHAKQLSLDRSVAIKVLPPELKRDKKFLTRFEQEAKSLARINHPNIMHVYDFGEEDSLGIYFMVMEFVDGLDLAEILRQKRRLPTLQVLDLVRQSALGLAQASEKGVVHRDIKPDNLMVTADGVWKVSDFGLAKHVDALTQVTRAGIRVGTPAFMSPEQCDGKPLDFRSDIYSLGITAYVALSGRLPFDGESPFAIMLKHKTQHAVPLTKHLPDLDVAINDLVMRMIDKDPDARADSWGQLIDELDELLESGQPGSARRKGGTSKAHQKAGSSGAGDGLRPLPDELLKGPPSEPPAKPAQEAGSKEPQSGSLPSSEDQPPVAGVAGSGEAKEALPDVKALSQTFEMFGEPSAGQPEGEDRSSGGGQAPPSEQPQLDLAPIPDAPAPVPAGTTPTEGPSGSSGPDKSAESAGSEPAGRQRSTSKRRAQSSGPQVAQRGSKRGSSGIRVPTTAQSRQGSDGEGRRGKSTAASSDRHRVRAREVMEFESQGDSALAQGKARKAVVAFGRALQYCQDLDRKNSLMFKLEQARALLRRKRRKQLVVLLVILLVLAGIGWWQGMPVVHRQLADQEWATVNTADVQELEGFIAKQERLRSYYTKVFPAYPIPALAKAEETLELLREQQRKAHQIVRVRGELLELQAKVDDDDYSWRYILDESRRLLAEADPADYEALVAIRDRAREQVDQQEDRVDEVEAMLERGDVTDAIAAADRLREDPRLGLLARRLPWPVELEIEDRHGRPLSGARILVDGIQLEAGSTMAFRLGDRSLRLEAMLPGYVRYMGSLEAGGADAPDELTIVLDRGRAWEQSVGVHDEEDPWAVLSAGHGDSLYLHGARSVNRLQLSDGSRLGSVHPPPVPQGRAGWLPWQDLDERGLTIASADGAVFRVEIEPGGLVAREVLRLEEAVQDYIDFEATFRDGVSIQAAVVEAADGSDLVGVEGEKEDWRITGMDVGERPMLLHRQARLMVVGNEVVFAVEEEGRPRGTLTLPHARSGPAAMIGNEVVLVPSHGAVMALRVPHEGDPLSLVADEIEIDGPPLFGVVAHASAAAVVTGRRSIYGLRLEQELPVVAWKGELPEGLGRPVTATLTDAGLTVAGESGQVIVFDRASGDQLQVVDHDGSILAAITLDDRIVVYDQDGTLVAYELVAP